MAHRCTQGPMALGGGRARCHEAALCGLRQLRGSAGGQLDQGPAKTHCQEHQECLLHQRCGPCASRATLWSGHWVRPEERPPRAGAGPYRVCAGTGLRGGEHQAGPGQFLHLGRADEPARRAGVRQLGRAQALGQGAEHQRQGGHYTDYQRAGQLCHGRDKAGDDTRRAGTSPQGQGVLAQLHQPREMGASGCCQAQIRRGGPPQVRIYRGPRLLLWAD